jgi:hypothetical protein
MLLLLLQFSSASPVLHVTIVSKFSELPKVGRVIKVPGYNNGTVCVASDYPKLVPRNFKGEDYSSIFDKRLSGRCVQFRRDQDVFLICYKTNSSLNTAKIGQFSHWQRLGDRLYYITGPGDPCGEGSYSLNVSIECDQTLEKFSFNIPSFTFDSTKCGIKSVLRLRDACKIPFLNPIKKGVHPIRCVSKEVYDAGIAAL